MQKLRFTFLLINFIILFSFTSTLANTVNSESDPRPLQAVFLGDSLTAGYGLHPNQAYVALLQSKLDENSSLKGKVKLINAGVSGDTTLDGLNRLEWVLKSNPDLLFVALGANDMMRGVSIKQARSQLKKIIEGCQKQNVRVALIGMKAFPNLGKKFSKDFEKIYFSLAKEMNISFMPFLLEGVAAEPSLNLPDGIHPNSEGHKKITNHLYKFVEGEIKTVIAQQPASLPAHIKKRIKQ